MDADELLRRAREELDWLQYEIPESERLQALLADIDVYFDPPREPRIEERFPAQYRVSHRDATGCTETQCMCDRHFQLLMNSLEPNFSLGFSPLKPGYAYCGLCRDESIE